MTSYWILFGVCCVGFFALGWATGYAGRINDRKSDERERRLARHPE